MKYVVLAALALALQLVLSLPAQAAGTRVNEFDQVFGHVPCNARGVCIISENDGGEITAFQAAARAINRSSLEVVIAGPCISACTIFADETDSSHICITPSAWFGYHVAFVDGHPDWSNPKPGNAPAIEDWVAKHGGPKYGGYPIVGFLKMSYKDALQFWKRCH